MKNFLQIRGLRVAYESDIEILRGVNFDAAKGSLVAIIGPNGAGKSTFLKGIAGIAPVTGGEIMLDGKRLEKGSPLEIVKQGIAFVPQESSVFGQMTVAENLRMGGWSRRADRDFVESRIDTCLNLFDSIRKHRDRRAGDLSGGQQKLVEIARGLVAEPSLLLLDEPTAGLSPIMVKEVYSQIAELKKQASVTIVLVEQNVREALEVANHVYVLAMGMNDTDAPPLEITNRLDEIVRNWMSHSGSGVVA